MQYYNKGFSTTEICKILGENRNKGYKLIKKKKIHSNKQIGKTLNTEEDLQKIKDLYLSGKTIKQVSKETGFKEGLINYWIRKLEIARPRGKKSSCNENYFEEINTPNKAYFLGLLFADGGYIKRKGTPSTLSLELKKEDRYILEEFKKQLNSNILIKEISKTEKKKVKGKEYVFQKK